MQKPSHSYWLLQLASWACLCLATLPQSSAEQVQGPEGLQIGLEVTSSKIEDSTHTYPTFFNQSLKNRHRSCPIPFNSLGNARPSSQGLRQKHIRENR